MGSKFTIDIPEHYYRENNKNLTRCAVTRSCSKENIIGWFERIYTSGLKFVLYINDTLVSEIANKNDAYTMFNALCREH